MVNLIEKEGRYFEKCKVVMLPTKDKTAPILKYSGDGSLQYFTNTYWSNKDLTKQHLYILSYNNIDGGDYVFSDYYGIGKVREGNFRNYRGDFPLAVEYSNTTVPYNEDGSYTMEGQKIYTQDCYKIIATTDKSLKLGHDDSVPFPKRKTLPTLSHKFIKAFVEQGGIDKVLVEYERYDSLGNYTSGGDTLKDDVFKLKTNSHNTITIKPVEKEVKKTYSREEVEALVREAYKIGDPETIHYVDTYQNGFENWLEKNL